MTTYIYALTEPDGTVFYIGKTNKPELRRKRHIYDAKNDHRTWKDQAIRALLKDGLEPGMVILETCEGDGCAEEIKHIADAVSRGVILTNGTSGGDGAPGRKASAETLAKRSAFQKKLWSDPEYYAKHAGKPFKGKHHSEETRRRWCEIRKGKKPHKAIAAFVAKYKGKKIPAEVVAKRTATRKANGGWKISSEHMRVMTEKARAANVGRAKSQSTRDKISKAKTGRPNPWNKKANLTPEKIATRVAGMLSPEAAAKRKATVARKLAAKQGLLFPL